MCVIIAVNVCASCPNFVLLDDDKDNYQDLDDKRPKEIKKDKKKRKSSVSRTKVTIDNYFIDYSHNCVQVVCY